MYGQQPRSWASPLSSAAPNFGMVFMITRRSKSGSERGFTPSSMLEKYCR